jgi:hypothetical protein
VGFSCGGERAEDSGARFAPSEVSPEGQAAQNRLPEHFLRNIRACLAASSQNKEQ